jgi:hypothetical protein
MCKLNRGNKVAKICGLFLNFFNDFPKVKDHPFGENSAKIRRKFAQSSHPAYGAEQQMLGSVLIWARGVARRGATQKTLIM